MRRNPFAEHAREAAVKKQRQEEEAAKAYADFAADFGGEGGGAASPLAFVHGGVVEPGSRPGAEPSGVARVAS